jgi:ABC-type branched-subunit amino acid transport system substrate-binding protein
VTLITWASAHRRTSSAARGAVKGGTDMHDTFRVRAAARSQWRRLLAPLLLTALVVAACGNSGDDDGDSASPETTAGGGGGASGGGNAPGVTDDEIRFAAFGTNSNNPLGTCNLDCLVDGVEAYFAFRNSEGGVHGRQLELTTVLDDELSNNQQRALDILSADDTFGAFSAAQIPTGWASFAQEGVPLYVWAIHFNEMNGNESIFGNAPVACATCTSRTSAFAAGEAGMTKVAVVGYGVSPASQQCVGSTADSIERYGSDVGLEVVYTNDDLAFGLPNGVGPEVTAMKDAGADGVYGCIDLNGMKTFAQELERQGMGDVPMVHPNTYDQNFVADAGELFEGDTVTVGFRPFEAAPEGSGLADFLEWMEETGSEVTEPAMVGWINADLAYQGLQAAGEDFDRQKVIDATNELTEFTAGGLIPPIDWSRQHTAPSEDDREAHGPKYECVAMVHVTGGEFELVGDSETPWSCWDGFDRKWSEPEQMNFE